MLAALTTSWIAPPARADSEPPHWFVADILCVHAGWHYSTRWTPHAHLEYVLWGQQYFRTWDVPDTRRGGTGEATWDAANEPYGGGVEMDHVFQAAYGSEFLRRYGQAGRWPVPVQILVAWRGWNVQGWGAWPNTSHGCGLR